MRPPPPVMSRPTAPARLSRDALAFLGGLDADGTPASPEKRLWQAVLLQALANAWGRPSQNLNQPEIDAARRWLSAPTPDFREACDHAGVSADWLHARYLASPPAAVRRLPGHVTRGRTEAAKPPGRTPRCPRKPR